MYKIDNEFLEEFCQVNAQESKPHLLIQFTQTFIASVKDGKVKQFEYSESQKVPVLKHDPDVIHFFRLCPKTSQLDLPNGESFDQSVANVDALLALKQKFLAKPFLVRAPLSAKRKTYENKNIKYVDVKSDVVVLFNPEHENIRHPLEEAFKFAEEEFEKDEKFDIEINMTQDIWKWYLDILKKATGDKWSLTCLPIVVFDISKKTKGIGGFLKSSKSMYFNVNGNCAFTKDPIQL